MCEKVISELGLVFFARYSGFLQNLQLGHAAIVQKLNYHIILMR